MLGSREGQKKGFEAIKKPDFIVCHAHFLNTTAQYSDVVLPVTTQWERDGLLQDDGNREIIFLGSKAIEPLYESRDDMWIAKEIGARLGLDTKLIESASQAQQVYNSASGAMVIKDDGKGYEPLLTITKEDIKNLGAVGSPQKGRIPFKELKEKGVFQVPRSPNDNFRHIPLEEFRKDPVKNPVTTKSGKLEIHCEDLAEFVANFGWSVIKPVPEYVQPIEGYEASFRTGKPKQRVNIHCSSIRSIISAGQGQHMTMFHGSERPGLRNFLLIRSMQRRVALSMEIQLKPAAAMGQLSDARMLPAGSALV